MKENKPCNESRFSRYTQWFQDLLSGVNDLSLTLRLKLFLLLTVLVVSIIFSVLVILTITGTFTSGIRDTEKGISKELDRFRTDVENQYGKISAYTVEFSEDLSRDLEAELALQDLKPSELQNHPEVLEGLIEKEYDKSLFAMQKANGSGVFFLLDATVNPSLLGAANSKAGLYLKNMEPNILNSTPEYLFMLRGPSHIGRLNGVTLHPQWRMQFDVTDADYYYTPVNAANETNLPLSRLFYWSRAITLPGTTEQVMLCSAPLIDSNGKVFGVCGFEVSSMLFKLSHMPSGIISEHMICILAPGSDRVLHISEALVSAGYSVRSFKEKNQILSIRKDQPFYSYRQQDGTLFSGFHQPVSLYSKESAFENEKWVAALILPDDDISASVISLNIKLFLLFFALLIVGITISYFLSKKFLMPLTKGVQIIKTKDYISRTNVAEIDDLIEFLSAAQTGVQPVISGTNGIKPLEDPVFHEFVRNTRLLSPAERAVFNLYVEGYTAKQITNILCLSINTIKTHNKRIYMKLNVASREELLVYVNILKESGEEINWDH